MHIIGLMSGTSLDGLDVAYCEFQDSSHFRLLAAETYPYSDDWRRRLATLHEASAEEYVAADSELGHLFGRLVCRFCASHPGPVDCVASHGHTVFHQPDRAFTAQIGDGSAIHAETGLPVVCDFRRLDVALGGQGAPLVPIGDRLLFGEYDCCLNLGGIANLSYERQGARVAYDVCPCNMALNQLAAREGLGFDRDGLMARGGQLSPSLLAKLETLAYYRLPAPKTLGKEWFQHSFSPILDLFGGEPTASLLRTVTEHIALRLAAALKETDLHTLLVTGGGAKNAFLMERLRDLCPSLRVVEADEQVVDYKEAVIFALLAYLRLKGEPNTLASVTGASRDSSGGAIYGRLSL